MASILDLEIPLANGGHISVVQDPSGFLLLNVLKPDGSQDSSTPLSSVAASAVLSALSGITIARKGILQANI